MATENSQNDNPIAWICTRAKRTDEVIRTHTVYRQSEDGDKKE